MAVEDYCNVSIKGYLIYFNDNTVQVYNKQKRRYEYHDAYDFICKTKPASLFKWRDEHVGGREFNMILGRDCNFGVSYSGNDGIYDGRWDSDFYDVIDFVRGNMESMRIDYDDKRSLYELQMNYMLLWSSIDKYLALCNGGWFQHKNVVEWSKYDEFRESFENNNPRRIHEVNSSNGASIRHLNPDNPTSSAEYYYQLRCNVVHSGKRHTADTSFLENSVWELLDIFKNVLDICFDPERYSQFDLCEW